VNRIYLTIATLALGLAIAVAGCGGSSSSSGESAYGGSESTATNKSASSESGGAGAAATIAVASVGDLGKVLVDSRGFTLYYFKKDKGGKSACYSGCAALWPPLTTGGSPKGMSGAQASMLGTTKRSDGTVQVTYAGWPLYTYAADKKPGEANGNDIDSFGAQWYALHANGEKAE
jgi:predicted lipoprotein with Yx(FWY)xxD motif